MGGMACRDCEASLYGVGEVTAPCLRRPPLLALCSRPRTSSRSGRASILGRPIVLASSRAFHVSSRTASTPGLRLLRELMALPSVPTPRYSVPVELPVSSGSCFLVGLRRAASLSSRYFWRTAFASSGEMATDHEGLLASPSPTSLPPGPLMGTLRSATTSAHMNLDRRPARRLSLDQLLL